MRRAMNSNEKVLADHDDEQYWLDYYFRGRKEVEDSKWWYAWERFADGMRVLTHSVEDQAESFTNPLDTRDRIREYGPTADEGSAAEWEEPRQ
jgi:hypothetical protein